jgi:hypothetical protein
MNAAPALKIFAWLVMAWGAGLIAIALMPGKEQVHSPARRGAGVAGGLFFVLAGGAVTLASTDTAMKGFLAAAIVAMLVSLYLARHARKVDKAIE